MTDAEQTERMMTRAALSRIEAGPRSEAGDPAHGHSCELSARVDALEEGLRVLSAEFDRLQYQRRAPGRERAAKRRAG